MQIHEITKSQQLNEGLLDTVKSAVTNTKLGKGITGAVNAVGDIQAARRSDQAITNQVKRNTQAQKSLASLKRQGYHVPDMNIRAPLTTAQVADRSRAQTLDGSIENAKKNPQILQQINQLKPDFQQLIISIGARNKANNISEIRRTVSPGQLSRTALQRNRPSTVAQPTQTAQTTQASTPASVSNDLLANILQWSKKAIEDLDSTIKNTEANEKIKSSLKELETAIASGNQTSIDTAYVNYMTTALGARDWIKTISNKKNSAGSFSTTSAGNLGNLPPAAAVLAHELNTNGAKGLEDLEGQINRPTGVRPLDDLLTSLGVLK
jgi:hypothetical protein